MLRKVNAGFSFVEVMISMVILAFVALLVGVILTTSIKTHKTSYSKDEAYAIAREKLAELQQSPETEIQASGSEVVTRTSVVYTVTWGITEVVNAPNRALITVTWGNNNEIDITGFISASLVSCPIAPGDNVAPTGITTNPSTPAVALNSDPGTQACEFDTDDDNKEDDDYFVYTIVDGYEDYDKFQISGNNKLVTVVQITSADDLNIKVVSTDCNEASSGQIPVTIDVTAEAANQAPTDLELGPAPNDVDENASVGTVVGTFSTTDPDNPEAGQTFTYELKPGDGDADNGKFNIPTGTNTLKTYVNFNYEEPKHECSIRVRTTDDGVPPELREDKFKITVNNVNETPTVLELGPAPNDVEENASVGTEVGTFSTTDPDNPGAGQTFTYELKPGDGDADNDKFDIPTGTNTLKTDAVFNYEEPKHKCYIRVRTTDVGDPTPHGEWLEETFEITVLNVNEAPMFDPVDDKTVDEGVLLTFPVNATDPEGDNISYSADLSNLPSGHGATFSNETFSWTPGQFTAGTYDVIFTADDGQLHGTLTVKITVIGPKIYTMNIWGLHYNNTASSGSATCYVGKYFRGPGNYYVEETQCWADLSEINGKTVTAVTFRFKVSNFNGTASGKTVTLFAQDHATYIPTAQFSDYGSTTAWSNNLGSVNVNNTNTWYEISTTNLKNLVISWAGGTTNDGLILGGNWSYYGYYYTVSQAQIIISFY